MYQGWVTHTHAHLRGKCPHACRYCYVQAIEKRFSTGKFTGPPRLDADALKMNYGDGKTIFIDHLNDLWADEIPDEWIQRVLGHCRFYPRNRYVFQTKNPKRYHKFMGCLPQTVTLGITLETDSCEIASEVSRAPDPIQRVFEFQKIWTDEHDGAQQKFITIEPILKCNPLWLARQVARCEPDFVNVGADSKGTNLPEPTKEDVLALLAELRSYGVEIKVKSNLERILREGA